MILTPVFKANLHVDTISGEGVLVLSENTAKVLHGGTYEKIVPLIDGQRSTDEIVDALAGEVDAAKIYYALALLETNGHLAESTPEIAPETAAFWHGMGVEPRAAIEALRGKRVRVRAVGDADAAPFRRALAEFGIALSEADNADFEVVLTDDYLRSDLESYNRDALIKERPWLLVRPVGCQVWVGPLFRPGKTGCWACLAQRLSANRPLEMLVQDRLGRAEPIPVARGFTAATVELTCNLAATEVANWIARGEKSDLEGKLLTLDVRSWQTQTHTLVRLPQCPACGQPEQNLNRLAQPVMLESRKKSFTQDGGHRIHCPEETLQRYQHHVSPITGAVNMLQRYALPGDGVLHVYGAGQNQARNVHSLEAVRRNLRSGSSGKGASDAQAKASGLCEALERFSGVFRGDEPRRTARLADLSAAAIHPNACMLYSARQYAERDAWNARKSHWNDVPIPFDEKAEVEWTPVWSLTREQVRYLPTAFCYFSYPSTPEGPSCIGCSNGNAAGNTLEEAILQGFFELVERDAVALWWYNRVQRPAVDLHSFGEPYLDQVAEFLRQRQRDLWVLDLTTDLEIPTFAALSRSTSGPSERIMFGFGSHFDPHIALLRAVTELNQMLVWILDNDGDTTKPSAIDDSDTAEWIQTATVADHPYLLPGANAALRHASDYPRTWTDDLRDDVLICQRLVEQRGMEMLVLDQTRADIGLPVVKVIVPGLRHFWARYAPGRLYDVPVRLGWLTQPLTEEQLNPVPMFM